MAWWKACGSRPRTSTLCTGCSLSAASSRVGRNVELARTDFGRLLKGGEAARKELANCGKDSYAIGIYGKYGANIDSIGLICGKSARIANPPPPLTSDPNGNGKGKTYIQTGKRKDVPAATDNGKTYIQTGSVNPRPRRAATAAGAMLAAARPVARPSAAPSTSPPRSTTLPTATGRRICRPATG